MLPAPNRVQWLILPRQGLVCTAIATVLAVATVPYDVTPADALRVPAIILAVGLLISPLAATLHAPASIVHPVNLIAIAPVYWLLFDPIQAAYEMSGVEQKDLMKVFGMIGGFICVVWIAAGYGGWKLPKVVRDAASISFPPDRILELATCMFTLSFLRFAIPSQFDLLLMLSAFGKDRWSPPWARGNQGGWDSFLDHLVYFGYPLPCLAVLLGRSLGWGSWQTQLVMIYSGIIVALVSTGGSRRIVGVLLGGAFVVWFLTAKGLRLKHIFILGLCSAMVLVGLQLTLIYRDKGISHLFDQAENEESKGPGHLHVDDNLLRFAQVVSIIPEHHPHITWKYLLFLVVRPIPRVFWAGKPMNMGFDLGEYLGMKYTSLTTSFIGELYMTYGFLGCMIGGWIMGKLAASLAEIFERYQGAGALTMFGSGLLALFAGMRSGLELVLMSYGVLAWIAMIYFYKRYATRAESKMSHPRSMRIP